MPIDDQRLKLLFVGVSVMSTEQKFSAIKLNSDVGLCTTNVAAVIGY